MRILGEDEARYYCSQFGQSIGQSTGLAEGSIENFRESIFGKRSCTVDEGTTSFQQYRDCSLRDVERSFFFAVSHYRRSLDLMIPSSSPWAHVTLYYGSWFASRALLGIFGCTIFSSNFVIDVDTGSPGNQKLRYRRIGKGEGRENTTYNGSHERYWDLYYRAVNSLKPMVDPHYSPALSPISSDPVWQIVNRNKINYDSFVGFDLAKDFDQSFSKSSFPSCLPGTLGTQFRVLEILIELVYSYFCRFCLSTDALHQLRSPVSLRDKVCHLIYDEKPPGLVRKTKKSIFN